MYKLAALDLDGTLLNDEGVISEENIKALRAFSSKGGLIVLASGRMTACVAPFAKVLAVDCSLITYNGAMVRLEERRGRKVIYHRPVGSFHADAVIDYCSENGFFLNYYLEDILYARAGKGLEKYARIYSEQTGAVYRFIKNLDRLKGNSPAKMILITDSINSDIFRTRDYQHEYLSARFGRYMSIVKTNPEYLEFLSLEADKGVGLGKLADYYGIKREDVIAFGDGENDIQMLEYAGLAVVPSNAGSTVKKFADIVLKWDNNSSAVGRFFSKQA
jgi:Cof subfamily protein (haloacid dehalogenase superfamily)